MFAKPWKPVIRFQEHKPIFQSFFMLVFTYKVHLMLVFAYEVYVFASTGNYLHCVWLGESTPAPPCSDILLSLRDWVTQLMYVYCVPQMDCKWFFCVCDLIGNSMPRITWIHCRMCGLPRTVGDGRRLNTTCICQLGLCVVKFRRLELISKPIYTLLFGQNSIINGCRRSPNWTKGMDINNTSTP